MILRSLPCHMGSELYDQFQFRFPRADEIQDMQECFIRHFLSSTKMVKLRFVFNLSQPQNDVIDSVVRTQLHRVDELFKVTVAAAGEIVCFNCQCFDILFKNNHRKYLLP